MAELFCPGVYRAVPGDAVSTEDMRAFEINSVHLGVSLDLLMENAGNAVANVLEHVLGGVDGARIHIVAGKGGNGGDGLSAARRLTQRGARVTVHTTSSIGGISHPSTSLMARAALSAGVEIVEPGREGWLAMDDGDAVVDAMLGMGVRGPLRGNVRLGAEAYNSVKGLKLSIDVPTGVDPDTGSVAEGAVVSDYTLSMHRPKKGLFLGRAPLHAGEVLAADIGLPRLAEARAGPGDVAARIPKRPRDAHKGMGGRVLVVGGSESYVGASILASLAAYAAGADLVYLSAPISREAALSRPEIVPRPYSQEGITITMARVHAAVVGPGMGGEAESLLDAVLRAARASDIPVVIDADALKMLAARPRELWARAVLTPHRGEARLLAGEDLEPRKAAATIARKYGATTIVKAPVDWVCNPEGRCREVYEGAPEMSVGGTGDVLAGVIAGFLARRRALGLDPDPLNIAAAAAYVVGRAGRALAEEEGIVNPLRLVESLPRLLAALSRGAQAVGLEGRC